MRCMFLEFEESKDSDISDEEIDPLKNKPVVEGCLRGLTTLSY